MSDFDDQRIKTFDLQNHLPKLPVPELKDTMNKYLESVKAIADEDVLQKTENVVNSFMSSPVAKQLQESLVSRAEMSGNWMEDWWYDAYNEIRAPLPLQNMGSINPRAAKKEGSQLLVAAQYGYNFMKYWLEIRRGSIEITSSRGEIWDMFQYYNVFNASRTPTKPKDKLDRFFKVESEGFAPSHIIVLCKGHIWSVEMMRDNNLIPMNEMYAVLMYIHHHSTEFKDSLAILTAEYRDIWADTREALVFYSPRNKQSFETIDSAAFVLSLSPYAAQSDSDLMKMSLFGDSNTAWSDKNFNVIVTTDGQICMQADHCNVDAISLFAPSDFAGKEFIANWEPKNIATFTPPTKVEFDMTEEALSVLQTAKVNFDALRNRVELNVINYDEYGTLALKRAGLYADTIIQIAIQMAYYRVHKKFAPTYETASTRKFFHGRTETVRSCTSTVVTYIKSVFKGAPLIKQKDMLVAAYNAHNALMEAARNGQGIDRHLLGLKKTQEELNLKGELVNMNQLLDDEGWHATGGNGKFRLSTSFLGYDEMGSFGYTAAMCDDGYGCFYKIGLNKITFTVTCFKNDHTDLSYFCESLEWCMDHMKCYFSLPQCVVVDFKKE